MIVLQPQIRLWQWLDRSFSLHTVTPEQALLDQAQGESLLVLDQAHQQLVLD